MTTENCDEFGLWLVVDGVVHLAWHNSRTGESYAHCQEQIGFIGCKTQSKDKGPQELSLCPKCSGEIELVADARTLLAKA